MDIRYSSVTVSLPPVSSVVARSVAALLRGSGSRVVVAFPR